MAADKVVNTFLSGTHNILDAESIPQDAAQDSTGWLTLDGHLQLALGRDILGAEGTAGGINNQWFGYKTNGVKVHYRKVQGAVQYFNGTAWTSIISGLTPSAVYQFSNYSSIAGAFTIISGIDGLFKINNAYPGTYLTLWKNDLTTPNYNAMLIIDKARSFLWNNPKDQTGFYYSFVDSQTEQNGGDYTLINNESIGTGDGTTKVFTGTLGFKTSADTRDAFAISIYGAISAFKTITAITQATRAQITASAHGFIVGDKVIIQGVSGMTEINNQYGVVTSVIDANTFTVAIDSTSYTAYTSGGSAGKIELFTDDFNGNLTSPQGGTGTINYLTGAYSITFNTAPVNTSVIGANYSWEDSNAHNITDFTHVVNNVGSGGVLRQDYGGDKIMQVVVGLDGNYYSLKQQCIYETNYAADNTLSTSIYRRDMGVSSVRAAVSRPAGIIFMNTINPIKAELTILEKSMYSSNLIPRVLFPQYRFQNFFYDQDTVVDAAQRWVIVLCKSSSTAITNDVMLLCDLDKNTIDRMPYGLSCITHDNLVPDIIYGGSPLEGTTYEVFTGFDDLGELITNYWEGKAEWYDKQNLKKFRKLYFQGEIDFNQIVEVYVSYDDAAYQLVGTIRGDAPYIDNSSQSDMVGTNMVGNIRVGGNSNATTPPFYMQIKCRCPKFFKRSVRLVATGYGHVRITKIVDWDILIFEDKVPARFRPKQNVSLDGKQFNLPNSQI